ncbi:MAG: hypothetical protein DLM73_06980 [Chthoniobacterales bacterium]|nr:MAG: hypothetical protein DLM73_06980 [Chthoniobacterales bacterium]
MGLPARLRFVRLEDMKPLLIILVLASLLQTGAGALQNSDGRTITELKVIPTRVLQRSISPKFYKSLLISPVQGWVIVRGELSGTRLAGVRVVHSELGGRYDALALERAKAVQMAGNYSIDKPNAKSAVLVHLLIYQIADGTMALSFAHLDEPGGDQAEYYGCARLAVLKGDGKWTEIKGPESLEGKGLAVRRGIKNNLNTALKLESLPSGPEATNFGGGPTR